MGKKNKKNKKNKSNKKNSVNNMVMGVDDGEQLIASVKSKSKRKNKTNNIEGFDDVVDLPVGFFDDTKKDAAESTPNKVAKNNNSNGGLNGDEIDNKPDKDKAKKSVSKKVVGEDSDDDSDEKENPKAKKSLDDYEDDEKEAAKQKPAVLDVAPVDDYEHLNAQVKKKPKEKKNNKDDSIIDMDDEDLYRNGVGISSYKQAKKRKNKDDTDENAAESTTKTDDDEDKAKQKEAKKQKIQDPSTEEDCLITTTTTTTTKYTREYWKEFFTKAKVNPSKIEEYANKFFDEFMKLDCINEKNLKALDVSVGHQDKIILYAEQLLKSETEKYQINNNNTDQMTLLNPEKYGSTVGVEKLIKLIMSKRYVDKTDLIQLLIESDAHYLMVRPRRFGKTLLIKMIILICSCMNLELLKTLKIGKTENKYQWKKYPVIYLDFSTTPINSAVDFEKALLSKLYVIGQDYGFYKKDLVPNEDGIPALVTLFSGLINCLSNIKGKEYQNTVVILIDEYDFPIVHSAGKERKIIINYIRSLFSICKSKNDQIQLAYYTGITTFHATDVFSSSNEIKYITLDERYATLFGFTENEIYEVYEEDLKKFVSKFYPNGKLINYKKNKKDCYYLDAIYLELKELDKNASVQLKMEVIMKYIKIKYNGYKFSSSEASVFNPISVRKCLEECEFKNYWYETGTPTIFVDEIINNPQAFEKIFQKSPIISDEKLDKKTLTNKNRSCDIEVLMFQSGYLTLVKQTDDISELNFPNAEVEVEFIKTLSKALCRKSNINIETRMQTTSDLESHSIKRLVESLNMVLRKANSYTLPYSEHCFNLLIYGFLGATKIHINNIKSKSEKNSGDGRLDHYIKYKKIQDGKTVNIILVVEVKYIPPEIEITKEIVEARSKPGSTQIEKNEYYRPFVNENTEIILAVLVAYRKDIVFYKTRVVKYVNHKFIDLKSDPGTYIPPCKIPPLQLNKIIQKREELKSEKKNRKKREKK